MAGKPVVWTKQVTGLAGRHAGRLLLALLLLVAAANHGFAQFLEWARQAGGPIVVGGQSVEGAEAIAVDEAGNSYITGTFRGVATFGAGEPNETVLTGVSGQDIFVAKYDPSGALVWARGAGGGGFQQDFAFGIAVDEAGHSYVTGWLNQFTILADFGGGVTLTSPGAFVVKFDTTGAAEWATTLHPGSIAYAIAVDAEGNSVVAGAAPDPVLGGSVIAVWRVGPTGAVQWARQTTGLYVGAGYGVSVDASGNSYLTGLFQSGSATFGDGEPTETTLTALADGHAKLFVAKYDADGNFGWARQSADVPEANARGTSIATDPSGHSYVGGVGTTTLGTGGAHETSVVGAFIARYDALGDLMWARSVSSPLGGADTWVLGTARRGVGSAFVTAIGSDCGCLFMARYTSEGDRVWTRPLAYLTSGLELRGTAALGGTGHAYVAGALVGSATFGLGESNETILATTSPNHDSDVFLAKYVVATPTTTSLLASPSAAVFGEGVTLTAEVAATAGTPTGTVDFVDGRIVIGSASLVNGVADLVVSTFSVGEHSVTARYLGNSDFSPSESPEVTLTVARAPTTTALTVSNSALVFGETLALTAAVTSATGMPAGAVDFLRDGVLLGSAALVSGVAQMQVSNLGVGVHHLVATYPGDGQFAPSESLEQEVNVAAAPTAALLGVSATTIVIGDTVVLTATVASTTGQPTGGVEFFDGAVSLGVVALNSGVAQLGVQTLGVGVHGLSARYLGHGNFEPSTSPTVEVTVLSGTTSTSLTVSSTSIVVGHALTLTANVTSPAGVPTGQVEFLDGGSVLATASLTSGVVQLIVTTLDVGVHELTARYLGEGIFAPSVSDTVTVSVGVAPAVIAGVYWTGLDGTVNRLDPSTGVSTTLAATPNDVSAHGIAVDTQNGWVFWVAAPQIGEGQIWRARLDGAEQESVVGSLLGSEFANLTLDSAAGKMYWRDESYLRRANLDGSDAETLISSLEACPNTLNAENGGLVFDSARSALYFGWRQGLGICRTDADGQSPETVVTGGDAPLPRGITVDPTSGYLYFFAPTSTFGGPLQIKRARPHGDVEVVYEALPSSEIHLAGSLAIDTVARKIYWPESTYLGNVMKRANLDGSGVEVVAVLPTVAIGVFAVGDGDAPPVFPVRQGFIDFETRIDGAPYAGEFEFIDGDEYLPIGVSLRDSAAAQGEDPNAVIVTDSSLLFNETGISRRFLSAGASILSDPTFVEVSFPYGTREIAFDWADPYGVVRLIGFDEANRRVGEALLHGDARLGWSGPDGQITTASGGHAVVNFGATLFRVRIEAPSLPLIQGLWLDNLRYEAAVPSNSVIDPSVSLASGVTVGSQVAIARGVSVGARTRVSDLVVIDRDASAGRDVVLGVGALVARAARIGDRTRIGSETRVEFGVSVGGDGSIGADVMLEREVRIGDGVRIGDRTTVSRDSVIGHGVTIGLGTTLGRSVQVGVGATIGNNVRVRRNAVIPAGASIPDGATIR